MLRKQDWTLASTVNQLIDSNPADIKLISVLGMDG